MLLEKKMFVLSVFYRMCVCYFSIYIIFLKYHQTDTSLAQISRFFNDFLINLSLFGIGQLITSGLYDVLKRPISIFNFITLINEIN